VYQAVLEGSKSFEQIAAQGWADYFLDSDGSVSQNLPGLLVTPNWLPALGIQPLLGRNFREEEEVAGQDAVVMLSYNCWRAQFHGDPYIAGKQIVLNRRAVTVIGVLPRSVGSEIVAPLVLDSYVKQGNIRAGKMRVQVIARMKPGVTLGQARSEAEVLAGRLKNQGTPADRIDRLVVQGFAEMFRHPGPTEQNAQRGLWMTAVASGVVLLIACANVASLLLARGVKRHREVAVRAGLHTPADDSATSDRKYPSVPSWRSHRSNHDAMVRGNHYKSGVWYCSGRVFTCGRPRFLGQFGGFTSERPGLWDDSGDAGNPREVE
jgi:putative ABC transport system permease protein